MKRFANSKCVVNVLMVSVLCLLFLRVEAVAAEGWLHELRVGVLDHDTDNLWSGFSRERGVDFNAELIFSPTWELWGGVVRPNLGVSINDQGDTSKIYGGGLWEYIWSNGFFCDLGLGLALHDGETETREYHKKELGREILLRITAEAGFIFAEKHRISLMFDHISNGYTKDPNEGLDTLGIRYGYTF